MSDLYREQLIKTKSSAGQKILCVFLTLGTILLLALGIFFMPVILVAGLALGWAAWMAFQRLRVEYEYLYVNGELDIDTIYGRVKRKKPGKNLTVWILTGVIRGFRKWILRRRDGTAPDLFLSFRRKGKISGWLLSRMRL